MKLEELAVRVIEAAEAEVVDFMAVGAIAAGAYLYSVILRNLFLRDFPGGLESQP